MKFFQFLWTLVLIVFTFIVGLIRKFRKKSNPDDE